MANEQNLRPIKLTHEEAVAIGQKGGIASGKARAEKATMKKALEMLLDQKSAKGVTYRDLATLGLIKGAVKGNAQNYRQIVEMLGELQVNQNDTPTLKIEVIDNENIVKGDNNE